MHATHREAGLVQCAAAGSDVGTECDLRAEGALTALARGRRRGERTESERTIAGKADVSGERARAEGVSSVVEATEPANSIVLPARRDARRDERNAEWRSERDETRDRVRRYTGVEECLGVGVDERRWLTERPIEVER